ncbi:MAG: hypothetical protein JO107_13670 [Hyphomicrobiales bacterium]|nr:hypothetical protein [Hyphomicrobiales bacterium]
MTQRLLAGALLLLALGVCGSVPARAQTIAVMTNDLQALQAKVAAGDRAAYDAQSERLKAISAAIAAAKPETWKDKHETDAAVAYLLSGGRPSDIVRLLESGAVPESEKSLMRGALAYIVGDDKQARALLDDVDPRSLDLRMAGQVAFAKSVLASSKDPNKAIELLDLARLLAPGGLVEEAALRREIAVTADQRDIDRFSGLCRQYAARFGHSVYADRFLAGVANAALRAELIRDLPSFQKFHNFVSTLSPVDRGRFLLTVAREETIGGQFAVAGVASGEALQEAPSDSPEEARGRLYEASARIMTPEFDRGLAELQSVAEAKLAPEDQALLSAVRSVAAHLRQPMAEQANPPPDASSGNDSVAATIALAEDALKRTADKVDAGGKASP